MDITSYLLGKQQGGGSTPTLQNKSVTITENGITNVTADSGYDGLSRVEVTTNVSGGESSTLYPSSISFRSAKNEVIDLNNIDFSNVNNGSNMFRECNNVKKLHFNNFSPTNTTYMFYNCGKLETANFDAINLSGILAASNIQNMFTGTYSLTDDSLDKILVMCINCSVTSNLFHIGIRSYSSARIEALPHYQDFINAGWTTGY